MEKFEEWMQNAANRFASTPVKVIRKTQGPVAYAELGTATRQEGVVEFNHLTEQGVINYREALANSQGNPHRQGHPSGTNLKAGVGGPDMADFEPVNDEYPAPTMPSWVQSPSPGDRVLLFSGPWDYNKFVQVGGTTGFFQLANWPDKRKHCFYVLLTPKVKPSDDDTNLTHLPS